MDLRFKLYLSVSLSVPDEAPAAGGLVAEAAGGEGGAGEDVVHGRRFVRRPGGGPGGEAVVVQVGGHEGVLGLGLVTGPLQVRAWRRRNSTLALCLNRRNGVKVV